MLNFPYSRKKINIFRGSHKKFFTPKWDIPEAKSNIHDTSLICDQAPGMNRHEAKDKAYG